LSDAIFPYTTLFRSERRHPRGVLGRLHQLLADARDIEAGAIVRDLHLEPRLGEPHRDPHAPRRGLADLFARLGRLDAVIERVAKDRKSTRLNSSHVK